MIISASRRTDIPAFYDDWFMSQVRNQVVLRKNPYNGQILTTSLKPEDVDCIVFWTRNAKPMIKKGYLDELDDLGIPYYFQFTATGYGKELEKNTLHPFKAIDNINELADKIGGDKVIWRFDPIILSQFTPVQELLRLHEKISSLIHSDIEENVISFLDDYQKTGQNLNAAGIQYTDILKEHLLLNELLTGLQTHAKQYNLNLSTCAENIDLTKYDIREGKCIDGDLIDRIIGSKVSKRKDQGQRKDCGCIHSVDIGLYDTCVHGCEYCYATQKQSIAKNNFKQHDPMNQFIIPDPRFQIENRII